MKVCEVKHHLLGLGISEYMYKANYIKPLDKDIASVCYI